MYHSLGPDYRPMGGGDPIFPAHPERVRNLIYGFAMQAEVEAVAHTKAIAGAKG